jgi:hypothetical protein
MEAPCTPESSASWPTSRQCNNPIKLAASIIKYDLNVRDYGILPQLLNFGHYLSSWFLFIKRMM